MTTPAKPYPDVDPQPSFPALERAILERWQREGTFEASVDAQHDFYSAGDRSRFGNLSYDGFAVGHLLVVQKGNTVFAFMISGFVLPDADLWHELFDSRIDALSDL